jgi:O-acetyl-ADP-ribose deacetylase (regulator of RNase III)
MGIIKLVQGDITHQCADVIVNAANTTLLGGGGVDGAIHKAGGEAVTADCREIRRKLLPEGLPTGDCAVTMAGMLDATYIIHAVGPIYVKKDEKYLSFIMDDMYHQAVDLAQALHCRTVAFPAISTGVYDWPMRSAAEIALNAVQDSLMENTLIEEVRFVLFDKASYDIFAEELAKIGE